MAKVAINGFGRIGRLTLRAALEKGTDLEFVAVNDLVDAKTLAHLFKWDSVHRAYKGEVRAEGEYLVIDGKKIRVCSEKDPAKLPWKEMGVDIAIESTGLFRRREQAALHLEAGARKVIITAPARGGDVPTFVMGVNEASYNPSEHDVVSNASCTTNCFAPMAKVLMDNFGIKRGIMTTIHSYTNDQMLLDGPHKDLRRARAAAMSMIITTTGAAEAVGKVIPELNGKLTGIAIRVPTPDVSLVDFVAELEKDVSIEEVNAAFKEASEGELKDILVYCEDPLVSTDFTTNPASCIFDANSTRIIEKRMVKVFGWYDNEWGYSCRVVDLAEYMAGK
ncbi:MAG TPA: type I glyceraldehyde-3-phosphate dehydrogenase [Candidatus Aerophobetes bacterium]|uniref:Type I glyceraldehyde-3-phosphate dehydrogenase n=1 Tax=Aerophobetes bacterium TaxID=2030807 RepID=A0A7V0N073_UNCAE|nr:type I glyceraldehyde-3-phosphate dehydrogenase [Candidatus Aerophobetes bacterium]